MAVSKTGTDRGLFSFLAFCLLWIVLCIVFGIIVEWFVMTIQYPHNGVYHSVDLLKSELSYLETTDLIETGYGHQIIGKLLSVQQDFYLFITEQMRLKSSLLYLSDSPYAQAAFARMGLLPPQEYALATLNMIQVMTLRMVIILLSMPIFLIALVWALGTGLSRRLIRQYQVEKETAFVFHHAKRLKFYSIVIPVTMYLAWPYELSPITVFAPFALLYALAWLVMAAKFKKYF